MEQVEGNPCLRIGKKRGHGGPGKFAVVALLIRQGIGYVQHSPASYLWAIWRI